LSRKGCRSTLTCSTRAFRVSRLLRFDFTSHCTNNEADYDVPTHDDDIIEGKKVCNDLLKAR